MTNAATKTALVESCRREAIRQAGGALVKASDGSVIFDARDWAPNAIDIEWINTKLRANFGLEQCAYCSAVVEDRPGVPNLDDDATWIKLAEDHLPGCEWVETRAHRRDAS